MRKGTLPEPFTVAVPQTVALLGVALIVQVVASSSVDFIFVGSAGPLSSYVSSPMTVDPSPESFAAPSNFAESPLVATIEPLLAILALQKAPGTSGIRHVPRPKVPT